MQAVDVGVCLSGACGGVGADVPLPDKLLEIVGNVLLELGDGFGAEGMGEGLAFASVFCSIAGAEEVGVDGEKGIIVVTRREDNRSACLQEVVVAADRPLGPATGQGVDDGDCIGMGD